jgi:hypothetical protein
MSKSPVSVKKPGSAGGSPAGHCWERPGNASRKGAKTQRFGQKTTDEALQSVRGVPYVESEQEGFASGNPPCSLSPHSPMVVYLLKCPAEYQVAHEVG